MKNHSCATISAKRAATDLSKSTSHSLHSSKNGTGSFLPFGFTSWSKDTAPSLLFQGERLDHSGVYLLGAGYHRPYNPKLMRFHSPDTLSPFGAGGINAYAYCSGDPINHVDLTGHYPVRMKRSISISTLPLDNDTVSRILANKQFVDTISDSFLPGMPRKSNHKKMDVIRTVEKMLDSKRTEAITSQLEKVLSDRRMHKASTFRDTYFTSYEKALEQEAKVEVFRNRQRTTTTTVDTLRKMASAATVTRQKALSQLERLKNVNDRIREG